MLARQLPSFLVVLKRAQANRTRHVFTCLHKHKSCYQSRRSADHLKTERNSATNKSMHTEDGKLVSQSISCHQRNGTENIASSRRTHSSSQHPPIAQTSPPPHPHPQNKHVVLTLFFNLDDGQIVDNAGWSWRWSLIPEQVRIHRQHLHDHVLRKDKNTSSNKAQIKPNERVLRIVSGTGKHFQPLNWATHTHLRQPFSRSHTHQPQFCHSGIALTQNQAVEAETHVEHEFEEFLAAAVAELHEDEVERRQLLHVDAERRQQRIPRPAPRVASVRRAATTNQVTVSTNVGNPTRHHHFCFAIHISPSTSGVTCATHLCPTVGFTTSCGAHAV